MSGADRPLLLVTVGTDHHPFDRLISWVDRWLDDGADEKVRTIVQYSTSAAPKHGTAEPYLDYDELHGYIRDAAIVVCHGGATVLECRANGLLPIVVPRRRAHGEVVDDHQVSFGRRLGGAGLVLCCESEADLRAALDRAVADLSSVRLAETTGEPVEPPGVTRATTLLDDLMTTTGAAPEAEREPAQQPLRVLFLGGFGRSGSTLIERIVGELPGVVAAGELTHLWERGVVGNEKCSCGDRFHDCPFWMEVGERAFGGWQRVDPEHVRQLRSQVDRNRFIPALAAPVLRPSMRRAVADYTAIYERLCQGIAATSGASVVVDSSKSASLAFVLRRSEEIDLRLLHVVRDSRGVANSWSRTVRRPEAVDEVSYMPTYSPLRAGVLWDTYNGLFQLLRVLGVPTRLVRYEDLMRDPTAMLRAITEFAGLPDGALPMAGEHHVTLGRAHTVAGNPMRFRTGRMELKPDEAWRQELPSSARRVVSAVTLPLLLRYGYQPGRGK